MPHTNAIKLTPKQWKRLKALRPAEPRMVHVSAEIVIDHATGQPAVARGMTYNVGANAAKRERRAAANGRALA